MMESDLRTITPNEGYNIMTSSHNEGGDTGGLPTPPLSSSLSPTDTSSTTTTVESAIANLDRLIATQTNKMADFDEQEKKVRHKLVAVQAELNALAEQRFVEEKALAAFQANRHQLVNTLKEIRFGGGGASSGKSDSAVAAPTTTTTTTTTTTATAVDPTTQYSATNVAAPTYHHHDTKRAKKSHVTITSSTTKSSLTKPTSGYAHMLEKFLEHKGGRDKEILPSNLHHVYFPNDTTRLRFKESITNMGLDVASMNLDNVELTKKTGPGVRPKCVICNRPIAGGDKYYDFGKKVHETCAAWLLDELDDDDEGEEDQGVRHGV